VEATATSMPSSECGDYTPSGGSPAAPSKLRLWLLTALGLAIGFDLLQQIIFAHFHTPSHGHMPLRAALPVLLGLLIMLADPALLLLLVRRLERRPLRTLGPARPSLRDFAIGCGAFVVARGVTFLYTYLFIKHAPGMSATFFAPMLTLLRLPLWYGLALAAVAGFGQELVARGYAIERFERITGNTFVAATIALLIDLAVHIPFWGRYYPC
jgi:membrane protease YdiL (CAAX protease family)